MVIESAIVVEVLSQMMLTIINGLCSVIPFEIWAMTLNLIFSRVDVEYKLTELHYIPVQPAVFRTAAVDEAVESIMISVNSYDSS